MYKVQNDYFNGQVVGKIVIRFNANDTVTSFVTNPNNTDYARFKKEIVEEKTQLKDVDGNTMTAAEAKAFVATLP